MRYISEILKDGKVCESSVPMDGEYTISVTDSKTKTTVKYTTEEFKKQGDYEDIKGVELIPHLNAYRAWSIPLVMFTELLEYVGETEDTMLEIPDAFESYGSHFGQVEKVILDELYDNLQDIDQIRISNYTDFLNDDDYRVESCDGYRDVYEDDELICRVWENCIYQNIDTNSVFINTEGDVYVYFRDIIYHYRIKNVADFKKNLTKIFLLYER
jgi:hypothetical protein